MSLCRIRCSSIQIRVAAALLKFDFKYRLKLRITIMSTIYHTGFVKSNGITIRREKHKEHKRTSQKTTFCLTDTNRKTGTCYT